MILQLTDRQRGTAGREAGIGLPQLPSAVCINLRKRALAAMASLQMFNCTVPPARYTLTVHRLYNAVGHNVVK